MGAGIRPEIPPDALKTRAGRISNALGVRYIPYSERIMRRWQLSPTMEAVELPSQQQDLRSILTPEGIEASRQAREAEQREREEALFTRMRTGEAFEGRSEGPTPREFAETMVRDVPKGLLTGEYDDPAALAVGMGIEATPFVGDLLFGARDVGFGIAEQNPALIAAGLAGGLPFIPSVRGAAKFLPPGTSTSARSLERAEQFRPTEVGRGPIGSLREMEYSDAVEFAKGGGHLRQGQGGRLVGAPAHIRASNINEMRDELDFHAAQGFMGHEWYARARAGGAEIAGATARQREIFGANIGIHSAQARPRENLRRALLSQSGVAATGEAPQVVTRVQQRQMQRVLEGEDVGEVLGPKTAPFARNVTPGTGDVQPFAVNDIWHARAFGYETQGKEFARGLGEAQHRFIDAETLLAAERANAVRLGGRTNWTPEEVQASIWVSKKGEGNASAFTAKRMGIKRSDVTPDMVSPEDLQASIRDASAEFSESFPEFTTYAVNEAVPGGATGHLPRLQRAGRFDFDVETHEGGVFSVSRQGEHGDAIMSLKPLGDENFQVTWSNIPLDDRGTGLGAQMYMEAAREAERKGGALFSDVDMSTDAMTLWNKFADQGMADLVPSMGNRFKMRPQSEWPDNQALVRQFSEDPRSSGLLGGYDPLVAEAGLLQRPGLEAQGIWEEAGRRFLNPAEATRVMGAKTSVEMGQVLDDASLSVMDKVTALRAYVDAQAAGAFHSIAPVKGATKQANINAVRITGTGGATPQQAARLQDAVEPYGFHAIHTGDGWSLLPFGENQFGEPLTGRSLQNALESTSTQGGLFGERLGDKIEQILGDNIDIQRGVYDFDKSGSYVDFSDAWAAGEGSGEVTKQLLRILDAPGAPAATRALEEGEAVGLLAGRRLDRDAEWAQRLGGARKDIQNARRILRDKGIRGLRKALESGKVALPVLAGVVLGARAVGGGRDGGQT
jgi:hypothetical protein